MAKHMLRDNAGRFTTREDGDVIVKHGIKHSGAILPALRRILTGNLRDEICT